jgi:hypothetical protein
MADYYPLIARAVEALDKNTGENRRALYERARTALVAQLRGVVPALEESEITRERLALEEAIRKIEAESARRAREEARVPRRSEPPPHREEPAPRQAPPPPPVVAEPPPAKPSAGERRSLSEEALHGFRETVAHPDRPAPPRRPARPMVSERPAAAPPHPLEPYGQLEPQLEPDNLWSTPLEPTSASQPQGRQRGQGRPKPPAAPAFDDADVPRARRRGVDKRMVLFVLLLAVIGALAAVGWWQRDTIAASAGRLIAWVRSPTPPAPPIETVTPTQPKIPDRIGQPGPQPGAPVAQRVVLYEEDPDDPQGKRLTGTVVWGSEVLPPSPGRQAEMAVRARIEIPERKLAVTWSLRRNTDQSLPASHTIEIMFNLPPDAPAGGVQNVPGVLMKQAEQTRGVPLAGLAVKVTPGYFLIGLSSLESDVQRNIQLLKERSWFDIPIVYNNNRRAILAMEKGIPGEKAFNDAFAAWRQ